MTYLIVGVDGRTLVPWHRNVLAPDASAARDIGRSRAANEGVVLVVAAVIDAGGQVVPTVPILGFDAGRSRRARCGPAGRPPGSNRSRRMEMRSVSSEAVALVGGLLFLLIAVVGGGFTAKEIIIPGVPGWGRIASLAVGVALVVPYFSEELRSDAAPLPEARIAASTDRFRSHGRQHRARRARPDRRVARRSRGRRSGRDGGRVGPGGRRQHRGRVHAAQCRRRRDLADRRVRRRTHAGRRERGLRQRRRAHRPAARRADHRPWLESGRRRRAVDALPLLPARDSAVLPGRVASVSRSSSRADNHAHHASPEPGAPDRRRDHAIGLLEDASTAPVRDPSRSRAPIASPASRTTMLERCATAAFSTATSGLSSTPRRSSRQPIAAASASDAPATRNAG